MGRYETTFVMTEGRHGYPGPRLPRLERLLRRSLILTSTEIEATLRSRRRRLACTYVCEAVPDRDGSLRHAIGRRRLRRAG